MLGFNLLELETVVLFEVAGESSKGSAVSMTAKANSEICKMISKV